MLSAVVDRDGQLTSATQDHHRALADADHLALLHAIWTAETTPARQQRYQDLLANSLPPGYRAEPGHQARWLWRTLHVAELAGLDPARPGPGHPLDRLDWQRRAASVGARRELSGWKPPRRPHRTRTRRKPPRTCAGLPG